MKNPVKKNLHKTSRPAIFVDRKKEEKRKPKKIDKSGEEE